MKITVSLPDSLVVQAREAVQDGRATSVSAYVAQALTAHSDRHTLGDFLAELDAELGPPDAQAQAWASTALGLDPRS